MKVLILSQYFPPEIGATQTRLEVFARHLADAGHQVVVVAEVPNHPTGIVQVPYRRRLVTLGLEDGYKAIRVWVAASPRKTALRRVAFYASYALTALLAGLAMTRDRPDVILASSPPLPVLFPALVLSRLWGRPFVADIRDIWPAVGVALGELQGKRLVSFAEGLERRIYRRAAAITCVTRAFVEHVRQSGIPPERVHHLPNGTLPDVFFPESPDPELRQRLGLDGSFVLGYLGNMGIAQGLEVVIEAADRLRHRADIRFLLVGDGPVRHELQAEAAQRALDNMIFHDQVPIGQVSAFINQCDVTLVPLRDLDVLSGFIPSKMFDFLACARPVLLMVDGEARSVLEDSGGGEFVPPGNPDALVAAVLRLREDPEAVDRMGRRGCDFVLNHYLRSTQAAKLERLLVDLNASRSGR